MPVQTTYTRARANLAKLFDQISDDNEVVIVNRRGGRDIAMIDAHELASIMETAHLMSSPKNRERLLKALDDVRNGRNLVIQSVDSLREEFGLIDE